MGKFYAKKATVDESAFTLVTGKRKLSDTPLPGLTAIPSSNRYVVPGQSEPPAVLATVQEKGKRKYVAPV